MNQDYNRIEDMPKEELDEPLDSKNQAPKLTDILLKQNKLDKNLFNTIKGHDLLKMSIALLFIIYILEILINKGNLSEIAKITIEIIKLIIFSLMGYLFATNSNDSK